MKVALLPKKTRGETAQIRVAARHRRRRALRNSNPVSSLTAAMLDARHGASTTGRRSPTRSTSSARSSTSAAAARRSPSAATTVRASVPDVLRLAAEALREPAFAPAEFEQLKRERLTRLEQSRTDPTAIARRAAARAGNPYPPDDVRYTPTIDEEIARVNAHSISTP